MPKISSRKNHWRFSAIIAEHSQQNIERELTAKLWQRYPIKNLPHQLIYTYICMFWMSRLKDIFEMDEWRRAQEPVEN